MINEPHQTTQDIRDNCPHKNMRKRVAIVLEMPTDITRITKSVICRDDVEIVNALMYQAVYYCPDCGLRITPLPLRFGDEDG